MPLDASIYNQVGQGAVKPLNQLDAMTNAYALQNAQLSGQAKQQEFTDDQAMRSAYKESGGDSNKLLQLFYGAGLGKQAAALQKSQLDADKIRGDIAKDSASTSKTQQEVKFAAATQHAQNLQLVKDPQDVLSYIDDGIKNGIFPAEKRAVMLQKANGYPSVQAWVQDQVQAAIPQLDRYKEEANNSRSAATNLTSTNNNILTNKTSAANNAANNARVASEGLLNRGVTIAGQDKLDARARELNKITADNKPLTEGQSKSALFGTRMSMANQIFDTLEKSGTTTSTPGMNSGYGVGSVVSALSGADQQQLMQAKRDFLNAVLRRESGAVIGESEFAGGEKQYFPQVGDKPETIAQKKVNREAAMRGVLVDVPEGRRSDIVREISGNPSRSNASAAPAKSKTVNFGDLK